MCVLPGNSFWSFGFWRMGDMLSLCSGGLMEGKIFQLSSLGFSSCPDIWPMCLLLPCLWSLTLTPLIQDVFDTKDFPSYSPVIAHY